MSGLCSLCKVTTALVIIGAINWGLVGLGGFLSRDLNVVSMLLGSWPMVEWAVYVLVGVSGVFGIFSGNCSCKR